MKLAQCNKLMFKKVICTGYLKKVHDGVCIYKDANDNWCYSSAENGESIIPDEDWGGPGIDKTYRKSINADFIGVVVGFSMIDVTGNLYMDSNYDSYGRDYDVVCKHITKQVKCAKVYYGCNRSRYVPLDCIKEDSNG